MSGTQEMRRYKAHPTYLQVIYIGKSPTQIVNKLPGTGFYAYSLGRAGLTCQQRLLSQALFIASFPNTSPYNSRLRSPTFKFNALYEAIGRFYGQFKEHIETTIECETISNAKFSFTNTNEI